ncbi:MAG: hypothetical protein E7262_01450 [Lachnospiraceae bacterium]|nr:hypothetical protein [Lachnospiraceae bacterium]
MIKRGKITKYVSLVLVSAILAGGAMGISKLNANANEVANTEFLNNKSSVDENEVKETIKEIVSNLRAYNEKEITINSLDDLYAEFDNYTEVNNAAVGEVLSKASDEVVLQYISNESENVFNKIDTVLSTATTIEDVEKITSNLPNDENLTVKNFATDNSYKSIVKVKGNYGFDAEFEITDESEDENTKRAWKSIKTWKETVKKEHGDRKFTYNSKAICGANVLLNYKSSFGYTVNVKKSQLSLRYAKGEVTGICKKLFTVNVSSSLTDTHCGGVNENIDATVKYVLTITSPIPVGWDFSRKHNMVATNKGVSGNTMTVQHYVNEYSTGAGGINLPKSVWDLIMGLL